MLMGWATAGVTVACSTVMVGSLPITETYRSLIMGGNLESMTTGGLNEHGVCIAIEFLPTRPGLACEQAVVGPNRNHWTTSLIANGVMRAKTAREAIALIGAMVDEYGFLYYRAPHAGVVLPIADENETWLNIQHSSSTTRPRARSLVHSALQNCSTCCESNHDGY